MIYLILAIGVLVLFFFLKSSKNKDSHDVITEKDEIATKNKEELKKKVEKDLEKNKIVHVFVASNSDKYHYEGCRYQKETMEEIPLDVAKKNGYIPCKVCNQKKDITT